MTRKSERDDPFDLDALKCLDTQLRASKGEDDPFELNAPDCAPWLLRVLLAVLLGELLLLALGRALVFVAHGLAIAPR